ncbi:3-methyl-2-oxobutanoate hydroxymethyltransferase [Acetobacter indonesiensis]|uniref:3-methyl-2-oxobutanoate hydroxymethyltransferase n=1 Tax=Acetobacter indonesiensis TaxID=104101 RepID=UPI000A3BB20E|nr:3-methyl-2-oxobutanoate hydroxymethyltransferase [Acetobacter indonesiensis]MCG0994023.1 3-methyl-2-oxobutanoate hydroxymethyltransferase [Acetobacter indonesiensis]MCI1438015.1 3-methyl-2-oxobutanoate hydroxymethyltransferase [Acetobacter indonesiensis]MCI1545604.1 3-methyl-2-oxobutanoate hydroxymethyltransferase [Acetobacter indonesiensis]MCI1765232.1 3-methyl-2-oxobutanoate hydroxymethyltransferase [Acetobacter indonesiensis]MCP1230645.1 3-methyl-2-oxobutanoate hydroxymethyltransferase [
MSKHGATKRHTPRSLAALETPVVALTAYTAPMAKLMDPHCDLLLVGDSLGMVVYGMDSTLAVTTDMMIAHGQAVVRGSQRACVAIDLPFGSYQESPEQAFRTSADIMARTGAGCVKLEGGVEMAETIRFLTQRGIPVIGHIGLKPQAVHTHGGFRTVGRGDEADQIMQDAKAVSDAGAFAMVIESTMEPLARAITEAVPAITIGIGASPACGGQVLVGEDMLGLFSDFTPRFVKRFGNLGAEVDKAVADYAAAVRSREFPGPDQCVGLAKKS